MTDDINRDWYCSANLVGSECCIGLSCDNCENKRRKWPTPEQFRAQYGREYPEDGAVYEFNEGPIAADRLWRATEKRRCLSDSVIVCACTHSGKPPADWRPS